MQCQHLQSLDRYPFPHFSSHLWPSSRRCSINLWKTLSSLAGLKIITSFDNHIHWSYNGCLVPSMQLIYFPKNWLSGIFAARWTDRYRTRRACFRLCLYFYMVPYDECVVCIIWTSCHRTLHSQLLSKPSMGVLPVLMDLCFPMVKVSTALIQIILTSYRPVWLIFVLFCWKSRSDSLSATRNTGCCYPWSFVLFSFVSSFFCIESDRSVSIPNISLPLFIRSSSLC